MKIYTGYYGNVRAYNGLQLVGVSLGMPKWMPPIPNLRALNPAGWMIHLEADDYVRSYRELLAKLDYKVIIEKLNALSHGKDVVLLCYEKPGLLCHRNIVATWITEHGEYSVSEFYKPQALPPEKEPLPEQPLLFDLPQRRMWE
jgi:hypothetical protein